MKDTLQTAIETVKQTSNETLEMMSNVDSFYNSAWDKLIITASVAISIVGVIVPILIQWYQNKQLKQNEEILKKENESQVLKAKNELLLEINSTLAIKLIEFESKIDKLDASAHGKLYQLQGNYFSDKNDEIVKTLFSYTVALDYYLKAEEWNNLKQLLKTFNTSINLDFNQEVIETIKNVHNVDIHAVLDDILLKDNTQLLKDDVLKLKISLTEK